MVYAVKNTPCKVPKLAINTGRQAELDLVDRCNSKGKGRLILCRAKLCKSMMSQLRKL